MPSGMSKYSEILYNISDLKNSPESIFHIRRIVLSQEKLIAKDIIQNCVTCDQELSLPFNTLAVFEVRLFSYS